MVRKRDPHKVVDEIEMYVKKFNVKSLTFYDETLSLNKKWLKTICSEIVRRKLKISWSANVRADCLDVDTIQMMKDSGCWQALFGVESGVQKNLNKISKGMSVAKIQEAVELVSQLGIETLGMFMFGIPGETFEEGLETIRFACNIELDYAIFTNITPFPGTALYNEVKDEKGFKGLENLTPLKLIMFRLQ
ncbi:MAG: radical SAM protein [Chloroflexia bacterium]|nr:radical SAM protein [Chloroflexia bacterium]